MVAIETMCVFFEV